MILTPTEVIVNRKKQIEEAAKKTNPFDDVHDYEESETYPMGFTKGAEWADANPAKSYFVGFSEKDHNNLENAQRDNAIYFKRLNIAEAKLAIAVEALKDYRGIIGNSAKDSTTKWSTADEALARI